MYRDGQDDARPNSAEGPNHSQDGWGLRHAWALLATSLKAGLRAACKLEVPSVKQVTQTITIGDGSGRPGNCLQAAVASLLGLPLDEVPHFIECGEDEDWLERLVAFGADRGYQVVYRAEPVAFGLAFGRSPRDAGHAVVVIDGEIVWDPHPSGDGLVSVSNYVEWGQA